MDSLGLYPFTKKRFWWFCSNLLTLLQLWALSFPATSLSQPMKTRECKEQLQAERKNSYHELWVPCLYPGGSPALHNYEEDEEATQKQQWHNGGNSDRQKKKDTEESQNWMTNMTTRVTKMCLLCTRNKCPHFIQEKTEAQGARILP